MVMCCPDTRATQTVIHKDIGLFIDPLGTKISTVTGGGMTVVVESKFCLQYKHQKRYTTSLISSDVRFTIVVAWHDLQPLHVISESFPACLCETQHKPVQVAIVMMYPEVFGIH